MIQSVLISGELDDARLARALGELADLNGVSTSALKTVIVVDSDGGNSTALHAFLEAMLEDRRARAVAESAEVKIYNAQSAGAVVALVLGCYREMAESACIGLHLPLVTVGLGDVDIDGRMTTRILEGCRKTEDLLEELMQRYGLDEPRMKADLYSSGSLRLTAEECLRRGLVKQLFQTAPRVAGSSEELGIARQHGIRTIRTILISGLIDEDVLNRVQCELQDIAADSSSNEDVVFLFDSPGGALFPTVEFLHTVLQKEGLRRIVERASVKIYRAHLAAALLAFSLGSKHELASETTVCFSLGQLTLQVGNREHFESSGRVSPRLMEGWRRYRLMADGLMKRLGLNCDSKLMSELYACGRVELTADDCLRRGLVNRLF